MKPEIN